MKTIFKASYGFADNPKIEELDLIRQTKNSVVVGNNLHCEGISEVITEIKTSPKQYKYFDYWKDAKTFLIKQQDQKINLLTKKLEQARAGMAKLEVMK